MITPKNLLTANPLIDNAKLLYQFTDTPLPTTDDNKGTPSVERTVTFNINVDVEPENYLLVVSNSVGMMYKDGTV